MRSRRMARRAGDDPRLELSPRAARLGGWLIALLLVVGVAVAVRILGGNADGSPVGPGASATAPPGDAAEITFGTELDPDSGEVAETARTDRFAPGETFAYSVPPGDGVVPDAVYVEVHRTSGETVQEPTHAPLSDPRAIAFVLPADRLFAAFGPGEYRMLIRLGLDEEPIAHGEFELIGDETSPSP